MIRHVTIRGYRGIDESNFAVAPAGVVIAGGNGTGKTSHLRAIRAALAAQDVGPDAVRIGKDKAEIIIDLEDVTVRRAISRKGSQVTVTTADGEKKASPQTFLSALLGASPLDPLDFFLASKKERRAQVLAALPISVDRAWLAARVPDLPAGFDCTGHGFDALERARKLYYDRRTAANATAKGAKDAAQRATAQAEEAARGIAPGTPSIADADAASAAARKKIAELEAQDAEAKKSAARTAGARAKIADLRARSDAEMESRDCAVVAPDEIASADRKVAERREALAAANERIEAIRAELEHAIARRAAALEGVTAAETAATMLRACQMKADDAKARGLALRAQADDLEATIAETAAAPVDAGALGLARDAGDRAHLMTIAARKADAAARARVIADGASLLANETQAVADKLDRVVEDLGASAQAELVARSSGIPGLTIEGDEVLLDGVQVGALCGAEQLALAVEISRRLNAKGKLIVCDGLERLDPVQLLAFVEQATTGGWQLIATRVQGGEVVFDAIGARAPVEARP